METMSLNAIKDRPWQIQACSALSGEGLSVSLTDYTSLRQLVYVILQLVPMKNVKHVNFTFGPLFFHALDNLLAQFKPTAINCYFFLFLAWS